MIDKISELIKSNYQNLTESQIKDITDGILKLLPRKSLKLSEITVGSKFKFKGYEFTKLADEEESCYCLLNDSVFTCKFGETNNWAKSSLRKRLNEFDEQGNSKVLPKINKKDLVNVSLNYYAYKIPNGRTRDKITVLSWEEAYAYAFENIEETAWLRSGNRHDANYAFLLNSSGSYNYDYCTSSYAVRPALHLKSDIEVDEL